MKFSPFFDLVDRVFLAGREDLLLPNMLAVLCLNCFVRMYLASGASQNV